VSFAVPHNASATEPKSREQPGGAQATEPKLVLIIDDEPDLLEVTSFVLESEGFRVETAKNGEEALALLRAGSRPRTILLDIMMPAMNGLEFLDEVAKIPSLRSIPIVVLTAAASPTSTSPAEVAGASEVLRKPIDLGLLVQTVERLTAAGGE
jgi:CheY-like chemotaxis protein